MKRFCYLLGEILSSRFDSLSLGEVAQILNGSCTILLTLPPGHLMLCLLESSCLLLFCSSFAPDISLVLFAPARAAARPNLSSFTEWQFPLRFLHPMWMMGCWPAKS